MRFKAPLVLLATIAIRLPGLVHLPTPGDEVSYAAGASVILNGGALYRDFLDHKPPLIYYTFAAVFGATSDYNLIAVHLVVMLVIAATGLVLGRIARIYVAPDTPNVDLAAALLYVAFSASFADFAALDANGEILLNLPAALALWAWLASQRTLSTLLSFATGALLCVATLYKYQAAVLAIPVVVAIVRARSFIAATSFLVGVVVPAAIVGLLLSTAGALEPLWQRGILYNIEFIRSGPGLSASLVALAAAIAQVIVPALVLYGFAAATAFRPKSAAERATRWGLVVLLPVVAMGGRFFPHYFLVLLVPLVALAARGVTHALSGRRKWAFAAALAVPILGLHVFQWMRPAIARAVGIAEPDYADVAAAIRANSAPRDRLFMWGQAYPIYTVSKRTPATRLIFWGFRADDQSTRSKHEADQLAGILDDLDRNRPRVIVDVGPQSFRQAPELRALVAVRYRLAETLANARVYVRRDGIDVSPASP